MRKSLDFFVLICSLLLTFGAWKITQQSLTAQKDRQLQAETDSITLYFDEQLKQYTNALLGAKGLFAASNAVERREFSRYFRGLNISVNYPGIYLFSYTPRVLDSDTPAFLSKLKKDSVLENLPLNIALEPGDEHYIVSYISYNQETSVSVYGFDLKSESTRRAGLESARDSGLATLIGPITIIGAEQPGFIISLPIYKNGLPTDTIKERQNALQGFVNGTFLYKDFFNHIFSSIDHSGIIIRVKDKDQSIFNSAGEDALDSRTTNTKRALFRTVSVGTGKWELEFIPSSEGQPTAVEEYLPNIVLIIGTLGSLLLFGTIFALSSSQVRATDIAEKMTKELRDKNEFIEEVLDNLPIGIAVNKTATGEAIYMNTAFETIYGWDRKRLTSVEDFFNVVYPDPIYRAKMKRVTLEAIESTDPAKMHWDNIKITTQTGLVRFISARNIPLPQQKLMVSTVVDTTDRSLAEKEINEKKEELEQINKLMIGRELKMVELKNQIEELKRETIKLRKPL